MWKYNNTDELYHYGVLGMRWGHRKSAAVQNAHKAYKQSKKEYRKAWLKNLKNGLRKSSFTAGVSNEKAYKKNHKGLDAARDKREKAAFKLINAASKDAYAKKLAKTGSKAKAEKASMKVHVRAMNQNRYGSGRVGSVSDSKKHHGVVEGNRHYYNDLVKRRGKKYANAVEKKYNRKTVRQFAAAVGAVGAYYVAKAYYNNK